MLTSEQVAEALVQVQQQMADEAVKVNGNIEVSYEMPDGSTFAVKQSLPKFPSSWRSWKNNPPKKTKDMRQWVLALAWNPEREEYDFFTMFWDKDQKAWAHTEDGATNLSLDYWCQLAPLPKKGGE